MVHPKSADKVRLYYKPTCTKSSEAKKILDAAGVEYEEIRYMENPPSYDELKIIAKVLEDDVRRLMRDKEAKEEGWQADGNASESEMLKFLAEHPAALQRPIVVRGDRAVIGRPVDKILKLIPEATEGAKHTPTKDTATAPGPAAGENPPPKEYGRSR